MYFHFIAEELIDNTNFKYIDIFIKINDILTLLSSVER